MAVSWTLHFGSATRTRKKSDVDPRIAVEISLRDRRLSAGGAPRAQSLQAHQCMQR